MGATYWKRWLATALLCIIFFADATIVMAKSQEDETVSDVAVSSSVSVNDVVLFTRDSNHLHEFEESMIDKIQILESAENNRIQSVKKAGKSDTQLESPTISSISSKCAEIKIKWTKVSEATGYEIYRKSGNGSYKKISTISKGNKVTYTDSAITVGSKYSYKVRAVNNEIKSAQSSEKSVIVKDHNYQEKVIKKATTSKNGAVQKTCKDCKEKVTAIIYKASKIELSEDVYIYNGKNHKPDITVQDNKSNNVDSRYYTVNYKNNKKVGKATVTIKFKGNYSGKVTKNFTIQPKGTTISSLTAKATKITVKWKKQATQTTGYEIQYSRKKDFTGKDTNTVSIGKSTTVSKSIVNLSENNKYYVRIRTYKTISVNGKKQKIYSEWSTAKTVKTRNGFVTEDGYTYYYQNGEPVKGIRIINSKKYLFDDTTGRMKTGWQNYKNATYYFNKKTGIALSGLCTIGTEKYYFNPANNTLQKGKIVNIAGKAYYFHETDGKLIEGIVKFNKEDGTSFYKYFDTTTDTGYAKQGIVTDSSDGSKYYVSDNGVVLAGLRRITDTNKLYFFDPETMKMMTGWQEYNGYTYYFDTKSGAAVTGLQTIGGKKYFFSDKNVLRRSCQVTVGEKVYYCDKDGVIVNGIVKRKNSQGEDYYVYYDTTTSTGLADIGGKSKGLVKDSDATYCVNDKGILLQGLQEIDGKRYLFDASTKKMLTGWQEHSGYTFYFDTTSGEAVTGVRTIGGKKYGFSDKGILQLDRQLTVGEKVYYCDKDGVVVNGIVKRKNTAGEYFYVYYDPATSTGLADINGKSKGLVKTSDATYCVNAEGTVLQGLQELDGKRYLFDTSTKKMLTGWQEYSGYTFYFDLTTGAAVTGVQAIDGTKYGFSEKGVLQYDCQLTIGGKAYYCNNEGVVVNGIVKKINTEGEYYYVYYDTTTSTGFADIGGKSKGLVKTADGTYCVNDSGMLLQGIQEIDGKKYTFDATTRKMLTGWQDRISNDGDTVTSYFSPDTGEMLIGWQEIDGKIYWLYGEWGALQKSGGVREDATTGKRYFLSAETGEALTGVFDMGESGYKFYFDPTEETGIVNETGLVSKNGKTYYFVENASGYNYLYAGLIYVHDENAKKNGTDGIYYFDSNTGEAKKSTSVTVGRTTFTFNAQGKATWTNSENGSYISKMLDFGYSNLGKAYDKSVADNVEDGKAQLLTRSTYACSSYVAACYKAGFDSFDMYESGGNFNLAAYEQAQKCFKDGTYFYNFTNLNVGDFVFFNDEGPESCEGEGICEFITVLDGYRTNIHHIAIYIGSDGEYHYCIDASESEGCTRIYRLSAEEMQSRQWTNVTSDELVGKFYITAYGRIW